MPRLLTSSALLSAAIAACASFSLAAGPSIGVNFLNNDTGGPQNADPNALLPAESAGAPGYEQINWNNFGRWGQTAALNDATGAATGATMTWDSNNTWNDGAPVDNPNGKLMHGYLDSLGRPNDDITTPFKFFGNTTTTDNRPDVWVTGLSAWLAANNATSYKVIVYADGDGTDNRKASFWLQSASAGDPPTVLGPDLTPHVFLNDSSNFSGTFTQVPSTANDLASAADGNFIVFDGLSSDSFMLRTEEQNFRAAVNGVQIVAVVPEPATLGLLGCGALALLLRRRRA